MQASLLFASLGFERCQFPFVREKGQLTDGRGRCLRPHNHKTRFPKLPMRMFRYRTFPLTSHAALGLGALLKVSLLHLALVGVPFFLFSYMCLSQGYSM